MSSDEGDIKTLAQVQSKQITSIDNPCDVHFTKIDLLSRHSLIGYTEYLIVCIWTGSDDTV